MKVVVAEPGEQHAAVLTRALADGPFEVHAYRGAPAGLLAAAANSQVLVIGPTLARAGLAELVPKLVSTGTRLLVVSDGGFDDASSALLYAGATGFISLADEQADVAQAVAAISRGSTALNPDIVHDVLLRWREQRGAPATEPVAPAAPLTTRERDVLEGLRDGLTTRLLARRLGVSEKTVEAHKSKLFVKLGARNQTQAVQIAQDRGLL